VTESAADPISRTFAALADPTRRAILARLRMGDATIGELAEPFHLTLATVSRHVSVLEAAGLVVKSRDAQWRTVRLVSGAIEQVDTWIAPFVDHFSTAFDRLAAQLADQTTDADTPAAPSPHAPLPDEREK
jgi:DNA-binding transcriptional ArsR family regulator